MTQEEFEHIIPTLRELMFSVGRSFFGNDDDAEDVAQEGLVALLKFIDRMEPGARHDALAIRVAKHCCLDIMRKRKTDLFVSGKINEETTPPGRDMGASPHEDLEARELHEAVNKAVQHLKPGERRLFEMRQIEGLELDDIAEQTNIAKTSIKSIVSAARKKVFAEIKERLRT
ncbi:MAG: sigma-70 family RNA polymerase sigma factor [Prevotella sp.]|nr:sigma-70 family RNA polymerase sigma factor [Prevotella sp.]